MARPRYTLELKVVSLAVLVITLSAVPHYLTLPFMWGGALSPDAHRLLILSLVIISIIISIIVARILVWDLNKIRDAAIGLACGRRVAEVRVRGRDQVEDLAAAFNTLSAVIQEQIERYRAVIDMAGDGVITLYLGPSEGIIRSFNRMAEVMFGHTYDSLPSRQARAVMEMLVASEVEAKRLEEFVHALTPDGAAGKIELTAKRKAGTTFPIQVSGGAARVTVRDDFEQEPRQVTLVTLIVADMTEVKDQEKRLTAAVEERSRELVAASEENLRTIRELKRANDSVKLAHDHERRLTETIEKRSRELERTVADLQKANDGLENARKAVDAAMASQEDFMANLNHELRTPLTVVLGYAEQLLVETQEDKYLKYVDDLTKIVSSGKDLRDLIVDSTNFLNIRRGQSMAIKIRQFHIYQFIISHSQIIESLVKANNNRFELKGFTDIGEITADSYYLWRVLVNLISNACKYTIGGEIVLSVERRQNSEKEWVEFRVRDTGTGVPAAKRKYLFTRYAVIHEGEEYRKHRGFGLGLSICKLYCESMGGTVQLEQSETDGPDRGSTFLVRLPAVVSAVAETASPPVPVIASVSAHKRPVLIIEDDKEVRDLLKRHLNGLGYESVEAADALEGLRQAQAIDPSAIILDVKLPDFNGWAVLAALKYTPETANIPVVLLTVVDNLQKGYALYAHDYLLKPFTKEAITNTLKRVLCRHGRVKVLVVAPPEVSEEIRVSLSPIGDQLELVLATGYGEAKTTLNDDPPRTRSSLIRGCRTERGWMLAAVRPLSIGSPKPPRSTGSQQFS